jgi:hypothetical protein
MNANTAKTLVSLLVIAGSAAAAFYLVKGPGPAFDPAPHRAIGKALADQAIALDSGGKIVLLARDVSLIPNPASTEEIKAVAEALHQKGHPLTQTNLSKVDPLRVLRYPPGDYAEILRKLNDNDIVISLLGPPEFTDAQLLRIGEKRPKIVALCTGSMPDQLDMKKLFDDQLLHAAVVSRSQLTNGYPVAAATENSFDALYAVIGTNNLTALKTYAK